MNVNKDDYGYIVIIITNDNHQYNTYECIQQLIISQNNNKSNSIQQDNQPIIIV